MRAPAGAPPATRPQRFADLPPGAVIAHRGGALQVPEHTMEGYAVALRQGLPVIEPDVQVLADGALGVMHDGTVDRTTTSSGNVADHTAATWKQLRLDAGTYLGGGWADDLRAPLFEEVLDAFAGRVLLCPEAKSAGTMGPMLDALERHGASRAAVLVQSFAVAECRQARARGWDAVWLGCTDPARAVAEGLRWIGPPARAVTAELCAAARAAGVRTAVHTVDRRWERDLLVGWGVDALFSDDPAYLHSDAVLRRTDAFAAGRWAPGMQADVGSRGRFCADDGAYGFEPAADGPGAVCCALVGHLRPPDPAAFTLDVVLRLDHPGDGGGGCGWVLLTTTDRPFTGAPSPGVCGYRFGLELGGALSVERVTDGVPQPLARTVAAAPVPPGAPVPLRITVTPERVALARPGTGEVAGAEDAAHRGLPVTHLGRTGAGARFRDVTFS